MLSKHLINFEKVFDPNNPQEDLKPAPEDMVAWLQEYPRLDAEQPSRVSVGGISGEQFDAIASEPKGGPSSAPSPSSRSSTSPTTTSGRVRARSTASSS